MSTAMPGYYCHKCRLYVGRITNFRCPRCRDTFIEELPARHFSTLSEDDRSRTRHSHHRMPFNRTMIVVGNDPSANNRNHFDIETILHRFFSQFAGEINNRQRSSQIDSQGAPMIGPLDLDAIFAHLFNQTEENTGPAPASETRINSIPTVRISNGQAREKLQCPICMDEFKRNDQAKRLPCSHHFHEQCIVPWLRMHGTCPTCRVTLDGDETNSRTAFPSREARRWSNNRARNNGHRSGARPTLFEFD